MPSLLWRLRRNTQVAFVLNVDGNADNRSSRVGGDVNCSAKLPNTFTHSANANAQLGIRFNRLLLFWRYASSFICNLKLDGVVAQNQSHDGSTTSRVAIDVCQALSCAMRNKCSSISGGNRRSLEGNSSATSILLRWEKPSMNHLSAA